MVVLLFTCLYFNDTNPWAIYIWPAFWHEFKIRFFLGISPYY